VNVVSYRIVAGMHGTVTDGRATVIIIFYGAGV